MMRPIGRKYDRQEHAYPVELDTLSEIFAGATESGTMGMAGAEAFRAGDAYERESQRRQHGGGLSSLEAAWGDAAMLLSMPYQGLGNAAVSGVATDEQLQRLGRVWAAMAITEPEFGSDSVSRVDHRQARRRRIRHQRREDLRDGGFARHSHRGVGDSGQVEGPCGDQVVHRPARAPRRHRRTAGEQAGHQGLRHRRNPVRQRSDTEGEPARQPRDRSRAKGFPGSWRPSTTPAR